jgi:uncharacterized repeat protein (TIGR02543 family)
MTYKLLFDTNGHQYGTLNIPDVYDGEITFTFPSLGKDGHILGGWIVSENGDPMHKGYPGETYTAFESDLLVEAIWLEQISQTVYNTNPAIYADGEKATFDKQLDNGWNFKNSTQNSKINWYFYDPQNELVLGSKIKDLKSVYAIVKLYKVQDLPYFSTYSVPVSSGTWYQSRWTYHQNQAIISNLNPNDTVVLYYGEKPPIYEFPLIELPILESYTVGTKNPEEIILSTTLQTSSSEQVNDYSFTLIEFGYILNQKIIQIKTEVQKFMVNFYSENEVYLTREVYLEELVSKPDLNPSKAGHIFAGWFQGGPNDFQKEWNFSSPVVSNMSLYAKFDFIEEITITFNGNGNTSGSAPNSLKGNPNNRFTITETTTLKKKGFTFIGYSLNQDGSGIIYNPGQSYSFKNSVTLYAIYKPPTVVLNPCFSEYSSSKRSKPWQDGTKSIDTGFNFLHPYEFNKDVAQMIAKGLELKGIRVVNVGQERRNLTPFQKSQIASNANPNLVISLSLSEIMPHQNFTRTFTPARLAPSSSGLEIYYRNIKYTIGSNPLNLIYTEGFRFSQILQPIITKKTNRRVVKYRDISVSRNYHEYKYLNHEAPFSSGLRNRNSFRVPFVEIRGGCQTLLEDSKLINSKSYRQIFADSIIESILKFFEIDI